MNVLLLSAGGGGGNILRSVKAMFRRDLAVTQKSDPKYAERLRRSVVARFLDTNEFSLLDVPPEERLLIGATTTRASGPGTILMSREPPSRNHESKWRSSSADFQ